MALVYQYNYDLLTSPDSLCNKTLRTVQGLIDSNVNGGALSMPAGNFYLFEESRPLQRTQMFIRECYEPLLNEMEHFHNLGLGILFAGTPGIGKTLMRNLVLKRILLYEFTAGVSSRSIILQQGHINSALVITMTVTGSVCEIGVEEMRNVRLNWIEWIEDKLCQQYYLVDLQNGKREYVVDYDANVAKVVVFCSPVKKLTNFVTKERCGMQYVPNWTLDELYRARDALGLQVLNNDGNAVPMTDAVIRERYIVMGGVASQVLEKESGMYSAAAVLEGAVHQADLTTVLTTGIWEYGAYLNVTIPHHFVHCFVPQDTNGTYDYRIARNCWCSKYIALMVANKLRSTLHRCFRAEVFLLASMSALPPASLGFMMTMYANSLLSQRGIDSHVHAVLLTRKRGAGVPERFPLTRFRGQFDVVHALDCEIETFLTADIPAGQLGRLVLPCRMDYPTIDSILVVGNGEDRRCLLVQVTTAHHRGLDQQALQHLTRLIDWGGGRDRAAIAFFVPPRCFSAFRAQSLGAYTGHQFKVCISDSRISPYSSRVRLKRAYL